MKIYEKPTLVMMSISGNDLLCSCQIDAEGSNADPGYLATVADAVNPFDDSSCTTPVSGYCKFIGTSNIVYNS